MFFQKSLEESNKSSTFASQLRKQAQMFLNIAKYDGAIAQLVEQRTENPCVPGSIPGGTTPPFIRAVLARGRSFCVIFSLLL